ncbi:MAG: hypothetical protein IKQ77_10425 [Prevotella sp.]|nr:hypothetical protein [Prevotella sp.]
MNKKVIIGIAALFVLLLIAMPYYNDYKAYCRVKSDKTIANCDLYEEEHPNGRYLDDVQFIRASISENDIVPLLDYYKKFPEGKHIDEINVMYDKLWDAEYSKYLNREKQKESAEAVKFMTEMLQYMRSHRTNTILVDIKSTLKLKDYGEYSKDVRNFIEMFNTNKLSIEKGMISLKSNFSSSDRRELTKILSEGVQNSFNKMFTPGFIKVESKYESMDLDNVDIPKLHFDYTISSQEENVSGTLFPHIWEYRMENVLRNYLIGISIAFNAHFTIPGSTITYDYSEKGEPEDNISNIRDIKDGYRQMTAICFAKFSNKMSTNLGLKEVYFQDEEQ